MESLLCPSIRPARSARTPHSLSAQLAAEGALQHRDVLDDVRTRRLRRCGIRVILCVFAHQEGVAKESRPSVCGRVPRTTHDYATARVEVEGLERRGGGASLRSRPPDVHRTVWRNHRGVSGVDRSTNDRGLQSARHPIVIGVKKRRGAAGYCSLSCSVSIRMRREARTRVQRRRYVSLGAPHQNACS